MALLIGTVAGAIIGMALFGGLLAWLLRKLLPLGYGASLIVAFVAVALIAGLTNSSPTRDYGSTLALYLFAAIPAYFFLVATRKTDASISRQTEPWIEARIIDPKEGGSSEPISENPWLGVLRRLFNVAIACSLGWALLLAYAAAANPSSGLFFAIVGVIPLAAVLALRYIAFGKMFA